MDISVEVTLSFHLHSSLRNQNKHIQGFRISEDIKISQLFTIVVLRKRNFDPISADIRDRLHWLPIRSRIDFKLGLLVYKCLHGTAPS